MTTSYTRSMTFTDHDLGSLLSRVESVLATEAAQDYFKSATHSVYPLRMSEVGREPLERGAHVVVFTAR